MQQRSLTRKGCLTVLLGMAVGGVLWVPVALFVVEPYHRLETLALLLFFGGLAGFLVGIMVTAAYSKLGGKPIVSLIAMGIGAVVGAVMGLYLYRMYSREFYEYEYESDADLLAMLVGVLLGSLAAFLLTFLFRGAFQLSVILWNKRKRG